MPALSLNRRRHILRGHLVEWTKQANPVWEYWFSKDQFYEIMRDDDGWVGRGHFEIGRKIQVDPPKAEVNLRNRARI